MNTTSLKHLDADFGSTYEPLPYVKDPYGGNTAEDPHAGVEWSRGVLDMAEAMQENRPQRITGAQLRMS